MTSDPSIIVSEWTGSGTRIADGAPVSLAGVLVLEAHGGSLTRVRDYMDVLGLAHSTGRLSALAAQLQSAST
jgi:ketosteroid isomerase-like protein